MKFSRSRFHEFVEFVKRSIAVLTAVQLLISYPLAAFGSDSVNPAPQHEAQTLTPIKHVIIILGENRTFDHVYATYVPHHGQYVSNLLFKGMVKSDGTPGPNYLRSAQTRAKDTNHYSLAPGNKTLYFPLTTPTTTYASTVASDTAPPPFATLAAAQLAETDLEPADEHLLLTGATGLPQHSVDTRIQNVNNLGPGVYQITGPNLKADDYTGDPVHRFYQMWQQFDCSASRVSEHNRNGCLHDLFPWVETTIGTGSNGNPRPANFNALTTGEGAINMGFLNIQQGDAAYMKFLADHYTLSDNTHQSVMGGTGANHIMFGYADDIWYSDGHGNPATPPSNQIENPDPQPGTNNYYTQDGYSGGSYSNCSDAGQPGVSAIVGYLQALPNPVNPRCSSGKYYILNNYNPGYNPDGTLNTTPFTVPPTSQRHIGDALMEKHISFAYYGGHWDRAVAGLPNAYCGICNPFQYAADIMTNPSLVAEHIHDTTQLHKDIQAGTLPAVSIVKPDSLLDGHPASSKLDLFEGFTKKIVDEVQANRELWKSTAIFVTFDEGGGYYDSGYVQFLDFFGDGARMPLIVVSPYSKGGRVVHTYEDHVSMIKFIEKNWGLRPLGAHTRDNFPNPVTAPNHAYVPVNSPAIGDLMDFFDFQHFDLSKDR